MELPMSSQEDEIMPIPLNTRYGGIQNPNIAPSSSGLMIPTSNIDNIPQVPFINNKMVIKYKECLKNHAASMGGNATDGCGEFMPNGEHGTLEALTCSACNCHRNFHRKEIEGSSFDDNNNCYYNVPNPRIGGKIFVGHPQNYSHGMIMSYNNDNDDDGGDEGGGVVKKRFRTKFSQVQKEKMFDFAERIGWKLQKQEESVVQEFCQEVGVKRRVFKVWMHNNKHNLAKKNINHLPNDPPKQSIETKFDASE